MYTEVISTDNRQEDLLTDRGDKVGNREDLIYTTCVSIQYNKSGGTEMK